MHTAPLPPWPPGRGHSAVVLLVLTCEGRDYQLAQLGPEHCIAEAPGFELPPGSLADITCTVDGHPDSFPVVLPEGARPDMKRIPIKSNNPPEPPAH